MTDAAKFRREFSRWIILMTLNNARPYGTSDSLVLSCVQAQFADFTLIELRKEADYLHDRKLVDIRRPPDNGPWHCELTRYGVDIAEYTVDCQPGIARPQKYF
jgi:hypothetical protein